MVVAMPQETRPFRLIYRSRSRIADEERSAALAEIFGVARSNNKQAGITGALLVTDRWFVQALEGDETGREAHEHIRGDARHDEVTVIESSAVGRAGVLAVGDGRGVQAGAGRHPAARQRGADQHRRRAAGHAGAERGAQDHARQDDADSL